MHARSGVRQVETCPAPQLDRDHDRSLHAEEVGWLKTLLLSACEEWGKTSSAPQLGCDHDRSLHAEEVGWLKTLLLSTLDRRWGTQNAGGETSECKIKPIKGVVLGGGSLAEGDTLEQDKESTLHRANV